VENKDKPFTSQEIKDRLFLFNATSDYSYVTNIHAIQEINFMYPSILLPLKVKLEENTATENSKSLKFLTNVFKPSETAIKALGSLREDDTVKYLQILSVDLVNRSSN